MLQTEKFTKKLLEKAFYTKKPKEPQNILIEIGFFVGLVVLTYSFSQMRLSLENPGGSMSHPFHIINLVFHEAGHIIFIPLGKFMTYFGGSLMQCLVPIVLGGYFLKERAKFSASVMLWWLGQNFIDLAPYVYDSKSLSLPLLGGHIGRDNPNSHDWYWLLSRMGLRNQCESIGLFLDKLGFLILMLSLTWSALLLYQRVKEEYPELLKKL